MSGSAGQWWQARSPREQGLLILLLVIAVPVLFWYGVAQPAGAALDRAQLARDADERGLADVLRMASKIRAASAPIKADGRPIDQSVAREAERAGFTVGSISRDGAGAVVSIEAVRAQPFFAWVATLGRNRGLVVTQLSARPNDDATLAVMVRFERSR